MTTSEPTTGEIVEAIRACEDRATCHGCIFLNCESFDCNSPEAIADRLESQEQKLELLNGGDFDVIDIPAALAYLESVEEILPHASALIDLIQSLKGTAIELTARAEQAEKERDAAIAEFDVIAQDGLCEVCFFGDFSEVSKDTCMEDCCFQWRNKKRVLKQEGDGERCQVEF